LTFTLAVATILGGQCNDGSRQGRLVVTFSQNKALARTVLADHKARPTLRHVKPDLHVINSSSAA
jgi:hypothetical protein